MAGLIDPVLVGPQAKIAKALDLAGIAAGAMPIVATEHSHAAAARAVAMARAGEVAALMKGSLHTDELMGAAVAEDGLRTARRMSHVFVMDAPAYDRLLLISDAAININPDLDCKRDIVQNAPTRSNRGSPRRRCWGWSWSRRRTLRRRLKHRSG